MRAEHQPRPLGGSLFLDRLKERFPEARRAVPAINCPSYLTTQFRPLSGRAALVVVDANGSRRQARLLDQLAEAGLSRSIDVVLCEALEAELSEPNSRVRSAGVATRLQMAPVSGAVGAVRAACDWSARQGYGMVVFCGIHAPREITDIDAAFGFLEDGLDAVFLSPEPECPWFVSGMMQGLVGVSSPAVLIELGMNEDACRDLDADMLFRVLRARAREAEGVRSFSHEDSAFRCSAEPRGRSGWAAVHRWRLERRAQKIAKDIRALSDRSLPYRE